MLLAMEPLIAIDADELLDEWDSYADARFAELLASSWGEDVLRNDVFDHSVHFPTTMIL